MKTLHIYTTVRVLVLTVAFAFFATASLAQAFVIEDTNQELRGDFVLEKAKIEVTLDAGGVALEDIVVVNRTDKEMVFAIDVEDFAGSATDAGTPVSLLGPEAGPYSLKDYFVPEVWEFTLKPGQKMTLPVEIAIPEDATPGGLYGSVIVAAQPQGTGQNPIITRLAALFFVRVSGEVTLDGHLEGITLTPDKGVYFEGKPEQLVLTSKNDGSVHLNSYGVVSITNSLGVVIDEIEIEPYFTMPASVRSRILDWDADLLMGRYTATASINRGYDDIIDEASVSFWIIPWALLLKGFVIIVLLVILIRWIMSNFEIKTKKQSIDEE